MNCPFILEHIRKGETAGRQKLYQYSHYAVTAAPGHDIRSLKGGRPTPQTSALQDASAPTSRRYVTVVAQDLVPLSKFAEDESHRISRFAHPNR
jgi:hypothetical protein